MFKKILVSCIFLIFIFVCLYTNTCYATAVAVTDENLEEAFQKLNTSEINESNYEFSVSNSIVTIKADNESYQVKYDLTDKPTFSIEVPIENGMSYEEYEKQTDSLNMNMFGYVAVANIQGIKIEDAMAYYLFSYLEGALKNTTKSKYMIVDDLSGNVTDDSNNPNIIYTSEFGDRVMEYLNDIFKEDLKITDSTGINSYVLNVKKEDVTETSCKLVSTLSVNVDADFSKLDGYSNQTIDSGVTEENAEYKVTLKVGQKCKLESNEKITGYQFYGKDCVEVSKDYTEITATKVGTKSGYIHVGETKKSIYITVEENTENKTLSPITLKIGEKNNDIIPDEDENKNENKNEDKNTIKKDNTTISTPKLPSAGVNNLIVIMIVIFTILGVVMKIKVEKYKNIK